MLGSQIILVINLPLEILLIPLGIRAGNDGVRRGRLGDSGRLVSSSLVAPTVTAVPPAALISPPADRNFRGCVMRVVLLIYHIGITLTMKLIFVALLLAICGLAVAHGSPFSLCLALMFSFSHYYILH